MQTSDPFLMDHFTKHFSKNTQAEYQLAFIQWEMLAEWYLSMTLIKNGLRQYILDAFLIQTVSINKHMQEIVSNKVLEFGDGLQVKNCLKELFSHVQGTIIVRVSCNLGQKSLSPCHLFGIIHANRHSHNQHI
jgi:hypothetical protein